MATGVTTSSIKRPDNRVHLFRLQILIVDGGLLVLRNVVEQNLNTKGITLDAALKNEKQTVSNLKSRGIITQVQYDTLYPSGGKVLTTLNLDITLIIILMRNLKSFGLSKKFNWNVTPSPTDISLEADLWRLKEYRNTICHITSTTVIQETDFKTWWNNIGQILVRLNPSQALNIKQTIADFETCPLDAEEEERIQKEIAKWNNYEAKVDRLQEEMKTLQGNVGGVKEVVSDVKKNVGEVKKDVIEVMEDVGGVQKDISGLKDDVVGVKEDVDVVKKDIEDLKGRLDGTDDVSDNSQGKTKGNVVQKFFDGIRYRRNKKWLRKHLIKFYKNKRSTVPLSPLVEEKDTPLAGFYVMPGMVTVKQVSLTSHQEERTPVRSLRDLFITGSLDQQEIYLSADAGFGKTSFSKYLAITWSQACCPDNNKICFKKDELKALADFEFVFLVLLRDATGVCSIDEMIEQQLIKNLPHTSQCPLQEILDREKCLIILDGLDEWKHPDNGCSGQNEKIPHRYSRENCVILTTTRPWKLGVSNLKTSEISKKVELFQLSKDSTCQLEKNAIRKMCGVNDDELEEKTSDFKKVIASRGLEHMQTIPLLLMYITCLWCNKIPIGDSKVEVYINIIEFLLSRAAQNHKEVHPSSESSHKDIPEYFKQKKFCQKFYSLLMALAELAYHTLFNDREENTLVFDGSVAEKFLKADDMKLSLLSGILTGGTTTTLIERTSKVSFSHKTVQEFFAAIFISSQSNGQKAILEKCKNVQYILDMSMICQFLNNMNSKLIGEILSNIMSVIETCTNVQSILDMSMVFEFLSKVNSKMMCGILADLVSVISGDYKTHNYRTTKDVHWNISSEPLYDIQKMLVSRVREIQESENINLCLQDFFIDVDTIHDKHLQRLSKLNKNNIKSLYIDVENTSSSLRDIIEFFSLNDLNNLHKLYYYGDRKNADLSMLLFPSLKIVRLLGAAWTHYEDIFCEKLKTLKNVQYLDIRLLKLSHEILEMIYNFISGNKTIKELTLCSLYCKEHGNRGCQISFDLSKNSQLKNVHLSFIKLEDSSVLLSRDMLNIERVELLGIEISGRSLQKMVDNMEDLPKSVTVEMWNIKPYAEYERVVNHVRSLPSFVVTRDIRQCMFVFQTRKLR